MVIWQISKQHAGASAHCRADHGSLHAEQKAMPSWWACRFLTSISDKLHPLFHHDKTEKRRIEIIGASIQAGFGDLGNNATCSESPTEQDTTLASGGDVARFFGADYNNVAFQGTGVLIVLNRFLSA